ncbi:MAG TPA: T9SS type A sorting domain-containing protein, partial [Saprospiraceae bacterium]|nr:T9SS type A sorting domain-containing protein [Saprospiraceae bacterium]
NLLAPLSFPIYYTKDFGQSWKVSKFDGVPDGELLAGGGDPVIVFDSKGWAHMTWLTVTLTLPSLKAEMALRYAYSKDGGATWIASEKMIDTGDIDPTDPIKSKRLIDKEWLAIDRSNSVYQDDIYMVYVELIPDSLENVAGTILIKKKLANDLDFSEQAVAVNTNDYVLVQFSSIAVDNEGVVHVFFMGVDDADHTAFYHAKSIDGGASFLPEKKISDFHLPGFTPDQPNNILVGVDSSRIYPCPHMRVDNSGGPNDGDLYAVWTANGITNKASSGLDIYFTKSTDGGDSWTTPIILNDDNEPTSHQFYPSLHVNEQGVLIVSWYDRRDDLNNIQTHYYMTYSTDGGKSFESNFAVSSSASDFNSIGDKNGGFGIGEYTQVIASSAYAIPVWSDGRTNDGNIDLFIAFVPLYEAALGYEQVGSISSAFSVEGPSPNPISEGGILKLILQKRSDVTIELHSLDGKLVQRHAAWNFPAGDYEIPIDVQDLTNGIYLLTVKTDFGFLSKKLVISGK